MNQKYLDYLAQLGPIMPADVKPVHVGWYARSYSDGREPWNYSRDYWDGKNWFTGWQDGTREDEPAKEKLPWRGLAQPHVLGIDAPAIADAMMADAASLAAFHAALEPVDAPDKWNADWMDEYSVFDELKPWQIFAIAVAIVLLLVGFSWLVN